MLTNIVLTILVVFGIIKFYGWIVKYPTITIVRKRNRSVFLQKNYSTTSDMGDEEIAKWNVLDARRFIALWKLGKNDWAFRKVTFMEKKNKGD